MSNGPFRLFISYSHKNEAVKDRLLINLAPLKGRGLIETWDDREIPGGADWREEIEAAMAKADAGLFLLDEYFLASPFCMDTEVASFLLRQQQDGALPLFLVTGHCNWKYLNFIAKTQLIPRDGKPITDFKPRAKAYTHLTDEIVFALSKHSPKLRPVVPPSLPGSGQAEIPAAKGLDLQSVLEKLPGQTTHLFGREKELQQLTGWQTRKGVFLWVADGGMGKSALTRWWLANQHWPADTRFLGHSFYSQGSHNQATSARGFLSEALQRLGVTFAADTPDDELGRLLAEAAAARPTVLLLDGMEPLQQTAPNDPPNHGSLKDRGLAALLEALAQSPGQAVCLASSRLPLPDIGIRHAPAFHEQPLNNLRPDGALALLQQRGIQGGDEELRAMAADLGHHPLSLVLAAEFCHSFLGDSAAEFQKLDWPADASIRHAAGIMRLFDQQLADERQALDRELIRILGLFDRPAPWGALLALKAADPPIPGLTEQLKRSPPEAIAEALARLRQWGLLQAELERSYPDGQGPELDAHPLVREHFGTELERDDPTAWRAAHRLLFDWFQSLPEKEQPDTLVELEPLYRAIGHGCKAGAYRTAREKVYRDRILRGNQGYSAFQLGAYSSDLATLAGFFDPSAPGDWTRLRAMDDGDGAALPDEALGETERSWLLAMAAFCLMSLGRLEEALGPRGLHRQMSKDAKDWNEFCIASEGLMDLQTPLGRWAEAEAVAREALAAAPRIEQTEKRWQRTMEAQAYLGRILHGRGRLAQARTAFEQAEAVQAENRPHEPKLYSLAGFGYAQLLLEQAWDPTQRRAVLKRGRYALEIHNKYPHHGLSRAFSH